MIKLKNFLLLTVILSVMLSTVSCADPSDKEIKAESIFLSESNIEFTAIGETRSVTANVYPANAVNKEVKWSTSDPNIATCENGVITAVGYGVCVVRATCDTASSVCTVKVPNSNPRISLSSTELVITDFETRKTLIALNDSNENISSSVNWESSNTNIAICEKGVVTAVDYGVCTITVISANGDFAVCTVIVQDPSEPKLTLSESTLKLNINQSHNLSVTKMQNAGKNVTWISSDNNIAVCENGEVTAVGSGICAIIAITEKGVSDCCVVTAGNYTIPTTPAEIVNFSIPEIPTKLKYVDKATGKIASVSVVTSYNLNHYIAENGKLRMVIEINCVKIYDIDGITGASPVAVTTQLYKENNVAALAKEINKYTDLKVGDSFRVPIREFYVESSISAPRQLYIAFEPYTEL